MTFVKFIKLVLLNAVSAAIHTNTHFGARKNVFLEATYHPDMGDAKNWAEQHFFIFVSLLRLTLMAVKG